MLALFVAAWLIPGIHVENDAWVAYAITAAILALLNAVLLPILKNAFVWIDHSHVGVV